MHIRHLPRLAATLALALLSAAACAAEAGYERVKVPDGDQPPLDTAIWYPTTAEARSTDLGPFTLPIAMGAPVVGKGLPLIVMSHGNGGSALSHHDTAVALAQAGYVVAAVTHTGDNHADRSREVSMADRPRHVSRAIDFVLTQWRAKPQVDPARVGVFGFSSGGFTAVAVAGGVADLARVGPHCQAHPRDYACLVIAKDPAGAIAAGTGGPLSGRDPRVRAAVVAAPALGFTFSRESLAGITLPVQLWRADADTVLPSPWYAEPVRDGLGTPPEYHPVPDAGHFDFLAPCTLRFSLMAPPLCSSQAGFDRAAFHREFNAAVVAFFGRTLAP
ncbi:alpha/beta hydrolase family protein [Piscinibacter gummiphilus]|uniref:Dienelactone hydrolase domain-containing protein n=1 Tax=Piscinibacter gummiphilus TaxID=946333 RepID=A0A1W6L5G0_9BURK|nr:dienelactone hydrolase family protein [Piscinibacter gummiphilus]ARN19410.1 hypothetical protein A4W93_05500 [Piscinibacter gummiphilus]ATU64077.1 dienelactone hydrolase [Piscinibacter gummiphilus]GLS92956.1 dienelactone hydrolase [Piscinibacter gummiphilus]